MINMFIAILVAKGLLTDKEGEALAKKVSFAMLPHDFGSSLQMAKDFFEEIERGE